MKGDLLQILPTSTLGRAACAGKRTNGGFSRFSGWLKCHWLKLCHTYLYRELNYIIKNHTGIMFCILLTFQLCRVKSQQLQRTRRRPSKQALHMDTLPEVIWLAHIYILILYTRYWCPPLHSFQIRGIWSSAYCVLDVYRGRRPCPIVMEASNVSTQVTKHNFKRHFKWFCVRQSAHTKFIILGTSQTHFIRYLPFYFSDNYR